MQNHIYYYDTIPFEVETRAWFQGPPSSNTLRFISQSLYDCTYSYKENHPTRYTPGNRVLNLFFKTVLELIPY